MRITKLIFGLLTCIASFHSSAQVKESLVMYPRFGGAEFEYNKDTSSFDVSPKEVLAIMKNDPLAYAEFKKARSNYNASSVLGFVGAGLIIVPVINAIAGGDPEWGLAAGGAVFVLSSIPFHRAFKRHAITAIDTFNKKHTAFRPRTEYYVSGLGARVVIKF